MLIESIFMELRSRLRSCNVYITTGIDFKKNCNLKISIQANSIILNYYVSDDKCLKRHNSCSSIESLSDCYSEDDSDVTTVIPIDSFCHIIPNSMSGLKIENNNISFRILTEPNNGGNFYTEFLSAPNNNTNITEHKSKCNVKANECLKLVCSNCSNVVSDNLIKFDRILELPTANIDMSEWFCCNHSHGHDSHSHLDPETVLKPNKYDFLYRLTYFVVNLKELSDKTNKFNAKRDVYHCNRCLAWLGLKTKDTVKLFNSTTKINQNGGLSDIFVHKNPLLNDVNTNDFIYTIETMIKESTLGFQYSIMCKLVLECTVSATNKQYLLIWIMDKELQVLQNIENIIVDDKVKLKSSFLTKILYKIELSLNEEVETWLADPSVTSSEISKTMFFNGVEHFNKMSLKVPEAFRSTNGFTISYLKA